MQSKRWGNGAYKIGMCAMLAMLVWVCYVPAAYSKSSHHRVSEYMTDYPTTQPPFAVEIAPPGEKLVIVDPHVHAWGAYDATGNLVHWGMATAGSDWCRDLHRPCHTKVGTFHVYSLGDSSCVSHKFPLPHGGAPMPYCMYFNGGQALHGSYGSEVVYGNISHGCVRLHVKDAEWLRYNFVEGPNALNNYKGTTVIVRPY